MFPKFDGLQFIPAFFKFHNKKMASLVLLIERENLEK